MPTEGQTQQPAGVKLNMGKPIKGTRIMVSRDVTIKSDLRIDNCPYKGNPVFNAQK